jgi:hypothetical protein
MDQNDLKMIAPHLMMFTLMRTDKIAYEDDPFVSQIFVVHNYFFFAKRKGTESGFKKSSIASKQKVTASSMRP